MKDRRVASQKKKRKRGWKPARKKGGGSTCSSCLGEEDLSQKRKNCYLRTLQRGSVEVEQPPYELRGRTFECWEKKKEGGALRRPEESSATRRLASVMKE